MFKEKVLGYFGNEKSGVQIFDLVHDTSKLGEEKWHRYVFYISCAGSQEQILALHAMLTLGKIPKFQSHNPANGERRSWGYDIEARGLKKTTYLKYLTKIENESFYSAVLMNETLVKPVMPQNGITDCIVYHWEQEKLDQLFYNRIAELVKVAVLPSWMPYLRRGGISESLLHISTSYAGNEYYRIDLDRDMWTKIIQIGVRDGLLKFEGNN